MKTCKQLKVVVTSPDGFHSESLLLQLERQISRPKYFLSCLKGIYPGNDAGKDEASKTRKRFTLSLIKLENSRYLKPPENCEENLSHEILENGASI